MLSLLTSLASCDTWAVIFCGSRDFYNYRHTADSYYMYHLIAEVNNLDKDKIILMCYDDIVNDAENPFKGQIFRSLDHLNVYPGRANVKYTAGKVTATNFYKVLTGDNSQGPALQSTANDNVMIFFDNHGGDGILGVPDGCGDYIYANDLKQTLQTMHDKGMYKNCFFPITACYAGSVAKVVAGVPKLYMMTAANDHESSYADIWDDSLGEYLTSEFSAVSQLYWQAHPTCTIGDSFEPIKNGVKQSHVMEYGDTSLKTLPVSLFLGTPNKVSENVVAPLSRGVLHAKETEAKLSSLSMKKNNVKAILFAELEKASTKKMEALIDSLTKEFKPLPANGAVDIKDWDNYKAVLRHLQKSVSHLGESFYAQTFFFANLANQVKAEEIIKAINKHL